MKVSVGLKSDRLTGQLLKACPYRGDLSHRYLPLLLINLWTASTTLRLPLREHAQVGELGTGHGTMGAGVFMVACGDCMLHRPRGVLSRPQFYFFGCLQRAGSVHASGPTTRGNSTHNANFRATLVRSVHTARACRGTVCLLRQVSVRVREAPGRTARQLPKEGVATFLGR